MIDDTRRLHARPRGPRVRAYGQQMQSSHPQMFDPFHGLPFSMEKEINTQFASPLARGFGYQGGTGPLANYINQGTQVAGSYIPQLQDLSSRLTTGATSTFGGYQNAVDNFMSQLPGFQSTVAGATSGATKAQGAAETALSDVMSPLQSRATFQEAERRALAPTREAAAARGMVEGGQSQAGEQALTSDLAFKALQSDRDAQQAAIQGVTGAAGARGQLGALGAQLASMGPDAKAQLFAAYPQLASLLTGATQLPMQGAQDLMSYFQSAQNPLMSLFNMIRPQMGEASRGKSWGLLSGH